MTLWEMSFEYRESAAALKGRILELRLQEQEILDDKELRQLHRRIDVLLVMWREANELAIVTARYYERGYRKNGKYTL